MDRNYYLSLRQVYAPKPPRLVIIAESPPASGLYFYDPKGKTTEPLFAALMRQLRLHPRSKDEGLREFQRVGWILIDATYRPINALSGTARARVIEKDYPLLKSDLEQLLCGRSVPIILIKANVCRALEPKLKADRFNVLNNRQLIYFPASGQQKQFEHVFDEISEAYKPRIDCENRTTR
jgi:hypothetical protein